jgi:hypothetical protein
LTGREELEHTPEERESLERRRAALEEEIRRLEPLVGPEIEPATSFTLEED